MEGPDCRALQLPGSRPNFRPHEVLCKVYFEDPQLPELGKGVYGLSALKFPQGDSELGDLRLFSQTNLISFPNTFVQANLSSPATSGLCDSGLLDSG